MLRHILPFALALTPVLAFAQAPAAAPAGPAQPKVTYDDHVRPILRDHCFACHAQDRAKGGLVLDSYAKTMEGGSSGEVVLAGDLDSSRLWALTSHKEDPKMPPMQDKLAPAKLEVLSKWIEQGALENSGSKANIKPKKSLALTSVSATGKPTGPVAMPEGLLKQPVLFTPKAGAITALAASPWAPLVAVAGQKQVSLYNSDTAQLLGVLPFPEGIPHVLQFSRNGSVLLVGGGRGGHSGLVVLFDVKTGKRIAKVGEELDAVLAADINNTHSLVALGGPSKMIRIYSTDGQLLHEVKKHTDWVTSVQFSPDGVLLATGDRSGGLFVWEGETAREYLGLRGHSGSINGVSWRPDSNVLASGSEDGTVRLWEMNDGNAIKNWNAHPGGVFSVNYGQDGRIVTAGRDKSVKLWAGDGAAVKTYPAFVEPALRAVLVHDGKRVLGGDWLGNLKAWDATEAKELFVLAPNPLPLDQALAAAQAAVAPKQAALTQAQAELAAAQKLVADKDAALKAGTDKHTAHVAAIAKLEQDRLAAVKQVETTTAAMAAATQKQAAAVAAQKSAADDKAATEKLVTEKTATAKVAADAAAADKAAAEKAATDKAENAQALADKAKASADAAAKAEAERAAAAGTMPAKVEALTKADAALAAENAALEKAKQGLAAANAQVAAVTAAHKTASDQLPGLKAEVDKLTKEKTDLEAAVAPKKAATDAAQAALNAANAAVATAQADRDAFNTMTAKLDAAAAEAQKQVAAKTTMATQLESERNAIAAQAAEKAAAAKAVADKLAALQAELAKAQADQKQVDEALAAKAKAAADAQAAAAEAQAQAEQVLADKQAFSEAYGPKP
jgi:WD40 repeat protein